jgi:sialic acid synthase SpsE
VNFRQWTRLHRELYKLFTNLPKDQISINPMSHPSIDKISHSKEFQVNQNWIGEGHPTYFIADIAANHNGDLEKAKDLIRLANEAGSDAAKFQHFQADKIVSGKGFESIGIKESHQVKWKKSVYEVYQEASVPKSWTEELKNTCDEVGIDFFTSSYDTESIEEVDDYVPAHKVGSGDITWLESIERMATKGKPVFLATGASNMEDVVRAVNSLSALTPDFCIMQCNTNYTGSLDNFKYINLNVLSTFSIAFPGVILGLSDHTPGHATVLGAVALGAKAIEKHFTDDRDQVGPDHAFSMNPTEWRDMVDRTRELEYAMGDGIKVVEENEKETVIIQRRSGYAKKNVPTGHILKEADIEYLRPAKVGAFIPYETEEWQGKKVINALSQGDSLFKSNVE